jgi:DNA-binding response OmpR family regulator
MVISKNHVLIVEDESIISRTLAEKIEKEGFTAQIAENGADGLKLAIESHPKLILLDIIMPKLSGLDMLRQLRQDSWGNTAQVLVLTNQSNEDVIEEAKNIGISEYMIKVEHDLQEIYEHIKKYLD